MTDGTTTIGDLKKEAIAFRDRRNWKQFHDVKNLAAGLSVEAAELLEIFLWKTPNEAEAMLSATDDRVRIGEELADILIFLLYLSEDAGIDLSKAMRDKLMKNEEKYPLHKSFNSSKKYTEL